MHLRQSYWLSLFAALALCDASCALSLRAKFTYTTLTQGGEFIFVMIAPTSAEKEVQDLGEEQALEMRRIRNSYAVSGLYRNDGSRDPLWTVDWYAYEVYPVSDGIHLVRPGLSRLWSSLGTNASAVEFYAAGQLIRSYKIRELVDMPRLLLSNSDVPKWKLEQTFDDATGRYSLDTVHGQRFVFDVKTGEILEGSRLVAWARSGSVAGALCALAVGLLIWDRRRRTRHPVAGPSPKQS
jgi:hypothetical protein